MRALSVLAFALVSSTAVAAPAAPQMVTEDIARFYAVYDAAGGAPDATALQAGYLDKATPGLKDFIASRIQTADKLAAAVAKWKPVYERARACVSVLPQVRPRLDADLRKLARLYPPTRIAPITVTIGRNNSGGTTGPNGVLIGLEALCRAEMSQAERADYLRHLFVHEYAHVQQFSNGGEDEHPDDVLRQSLIEGGADFVAELVSGEVSTPQLQVWTQGHEREIETAFLAQRHDKTLSAWLYNGRGTAEKPGDLGYWVGYRITKAYYQQARDKRRALADILDIKDPEAFLAQSGWTPGMTLRR